MCLVSSISELSCFTSTICTIEDDPHSPELGHPTTPPRAPQLSTEPSESIAMDKDEEEEEEEEEEEIEPTKKRTVKKDMC